MDACGQSQSGSVCGACGEAAAGELRQEDVLRQLAHCLWQGRRRSATGASAGETELSGLDLTAVAEFKATEKGGLEIKLVDRLRALELLFSLLESRSTNAAQSLYQALANAGTEKEAWGDD